MYGYHAEKRARQGGNRDRITLVTFAHHNVILQETSFNWNPRRHAIENIGEPPVELVELKWRMSSPHHIVAPEHAAVRGETEPVPVEREPHHRWTFEDQYVRVLDVVLASGESTGS